MKLIILPFLVLVLVIPLLALPSPGAYTPVKYCGPKQSDPYFCGKSSGYGCLHWHPDQEFCKDENAPLPSCCRATEKDSGVTACACCASTHGSKRISATERGWYQHGRSQSEVEYALH